jgi:glutamate formiminotransferase / 5-formyltetrahydrofolate cyclo-ligase
VVNVSEGRNLQVVGGLAQAAGPCVLDVHVDGDHHRSVFTLAGPGGVLAPAVRSLASAAVAAIDLSTHAGAHPRFGVLDVVPWVSLTGWPVGDGPMEDSIAARDDFARWAAEELDLPCFVYGPSRSLPEVRRGAWSSLAPDHGPGRPHPTAGACAVGARPILVAYNLWLASDDLAAARSTAQAIRGPHLRALGLRLGAHVQVSCNLTAPWLVGPGAAYDAVASRVDVERAELVGLLPLAVLEAQPRHRWDELGIAPSTTIEARLEQAGLDGGRFRQTHPD